MLVLVRCSPKHTRAVVVVGSYCVVGCGVEGSHNGLSAPVGEEEPSGCCGGDGDGGMLTLSSVVGVSAGDVDALLGASLRGGIRSFMASRPLASANELILWFGENPATAVEGRGKSKTIFHQQLEHPKLKVRFYYNY